MGALVGAVVAWLVLDTSSAPTHPVDNATADSGTPANNAEIEQLRNELKQAGDARASLETKTNDLREQHRQSERERDDAHAALETAEKDIVALREKIAQLEAEAKSTADAQPQGSLAVPFGKWADIPEVRDADWAEIGGAAEKMIPMLKELGQVMKDGKEMPPALMQKIGEENKKLIRYYARVMGKLPTNASVNGEFGHPINLANMLAAQLKVAGLPLSSQQLDELSGLGEQYDQRWQETTKGYGDNTFKLQKLLDEAELKEWFKAEMLKVCTPEQRIVAVPPEIDGLVGLDIYSAGLMFQMGVNSESARDAESLKSEVKSAVARASGMETSTLDAAQFVFDEWMLSLQGQLGPLTTEQARQIPTSEVIQAGHAQLKAYKVLHTDYARSAEAKQALRGEEDVILPRILAGE
jgi:hypothetical protein